MCLEVLYQCSPFCFNKFLLNVVFCNNFYAIVINNIQLCRFEI